MANPIWKDYSVNLGSADSYTYRVKVDSASGATIFEGRAYKRPGMSQVYIKVNDICVDYLRNESTPYNGRRARTFIVQLLSGTTWTTKATITFSNDWSYDDTFDDEDNSLVQPINGKVAKWQTFFFPSVESEVTLEMTDSLGETTETSVDVENGYADVMSEMEEMDVVSFKVGTDKYTFLDCVTYVLHYVNEFGVWESFAIEGNHKRTDNLTRYTHSKEYDNITDSNRGVVNRCNEIERVITLHTGFLSDLSASRMHHLLNSTNVFLEDSSDNLVPVVITNTATEYKTYKNNGRQLVNYDIEVTEAHNITRR